MRLYVSGFVTVRRMILADFGRFSVCEVLKWMLVLKWGLEGVPMGLMQYFGII